MLWKIIQIGIGVLLLLCLTSIYALDIQRYHKKSITLELNKGLVIETSRNISTVFIADPAIADFHVKAPGIIYLLAKKIGETSLIAVDKDGNIILNDTIKIIHNLTKLRQILKQVIPDATISVFSAADNIVLRGKVNSPTQAEDARRLTERFAGDANKVLNFLRVTAPTQVNLRVQVIEMSRAINRALGIDWTAGFSTSRSQFGVHPVIMPTDFVKTGSTTPNAVNFISKLTPGNFTLQSLISLLEQNGLVTVLSEPNLTALSGETASFLVGGEFPIPIPQGNTGAVTITFKKFGVSLSFTPTILNDGKINLQVRPEVSQLSDQGAVTINGFQVPSLATRRAQTTIELGSGQSFAIAGLLQNNARKFINQLPGLGDLPVLGQLFRSEKFIRDETELVIIVTPYIVQPTGNQALELPTDGLPANGIVLGKKTEKKFIAKPGNIGFIFKN